MSRDPGELAAELLLATRSGDAAISILSDAIASLDPADLSRGLHDDRSRLAFWIDVYNAAVQSLSIDDLAARRSRFAFFRRTAVTVAGQALSLDSIEHGLLRHSRLKFGLGYLTNPQPSGFEREHRIAKVDPRIHFALNCGANSCPPIATYRAVDIDEQLDIAARAYLRQAVRMEGEDIVRVPPLFLWFPGDFGGFAGTRRILRRYDIEEKDRKLRFARWDWTPRPGHWQTEEPGDR